MKAPQSLFLSKCLFHRSTTSLLSYIPSTAYTGVVLSGRILHVDVHIFLAWVREDCFVMANEQPKVTSIRAMSVGDGASVENFFKGPVVVKIRKGFFITNLTTRKLEPCVKVLISGLVGYLLSKSIRLRLYWIGQLVL